MIPSKAPHGRALWQSTHGAQITHPRRSLYSLVRDGGIKKFNWRRAQGEKSDLTSCDLRHLVCAAVLHRFLQARFEGASIHGARICAAPFRAELTSGEIILPISDGTSLR